MELTPLTSGAASATAGTATETGSQGALTSDFDTFLQLLTAQLRNQDPLNPMEGTEFVAQLAQFSAVEQQVRANDALGRIEALLGGGSGLTDWLGATVEAPVALAFDGEPVSLRYEADPAATQAALIIRTDSGLEAGRQPLAPGDPEISWTGALGLGGAAENGFYRFTIEERAADGTVTEKAARGFAEVSEARLDPTGAVALVFANGESIAASAVSAVRANK